MINMLDKWEPAIREMSEAFHAAKENDEVEKEEEEQIPVTNNGCAQMPVTNMTLCRLQSLIWRQLLQILVVVESGI